MVMRKLMMLATIVVGMTLLINYTLGNVDNGNHVNDQRDYFNDPDSSIYDDYVVVRGENGRL
ncbi:MAG: hypothetical protein JSV56_10465, partial [Methanomassiliicoccales archaeon]